MCQDFYLSITSNIDRFLNHAEISTTFFTYTLRLCREEDTYSKCGVLNSIDNPTNDTKLMAQSYNFLETSFFQL